MSDNSNGNNPRPLRGHVLVKQDPPKVRQGLIHTPQGSEEYPNTGVIRAVGLGVEAVHAGDRVIFERKPGSALAEDRRVAGAFGMETWCDLLVLPIGNVIAVVEPEPGSDFS